MALPYLHETLKPVVDMIFNDRKLIELDPDQLKNSGKSVNDHMTVMWLKLTHHVTVMWLHVSMLFPRSTKTIDTSVTQLTGYVQLATDTIFRSIERCPSILRQALRLLWQRVVVKFHGDVSSLPNLSLFISSSLDSVHFCNWFCFLEVLCTSHIVS